jgi:hypothetical protein
MARAFMWVMIPLIAYTVAYSLFTGNGPMFLGTFGIRLSPTTIGQPSAPLENIADLVIRKGEKDISLGRLCDALQVPRSTDGTCNGYQLNGKEADWAPSFNTYAEPGTGIARIFLVRVEGVTADAFLVTKNGQLQRAALGTKANGVWSWSAAMITSDLSTKFSNEMNYWIDNIEVISALPDR